jgi:hypothetical protein
LVEGLLFSGPFPFSMPFFVPTQLVLAFSIAFWALFC